MTAAASNARRAAGAFWLRRGYRKTAAREADFDRAAAARLAELAELEETLSAADAAAALDRTAACFAEITALFAPLSPEYARLWREISSYRPLRLYFGRRRRL